MGNRQEQYKNKVRVGAYKKVKERQTQKRGDKVVITITNMWCKNKGPETSPYIKAMRGCVSGLRDIPTAKIRELKGVIKGDR